MKTLILSKSAPAYGDDVLMEKLTQFVKDDSSEFATSSGALALIAIRAIIITENANFEDFQVCDENDKMLYITKTGRLRTHIRIK